MFMKKLQILKNAIIGGVKFVLFELLKSKFFYYYYNQFHYFLVSMLNITWI